jgi:hypothetical protein
VARNGYAVQTVYRDELGDVAGAELAGFRALMAEIRDGDAHVVIVPSQRLPGTG